MVSKGVRVALVAGWCVVVLAGCAPRPDSTATDSDNGGHVRVLAGELFDIVLADDYDQTGCQWREESNSSPEVLEFLGARYQPGRKPPAGVGNGTATERYRAHQAGSARVELVESDNGDKVCRRYTLEVTVVQPSLVDTIVAGVKPVVPYAATVIVIVAVGLGGFWVFRRSQRRRV